MSIEWLGTIEGVEYRSFAKAEDNNPLLDNFVKKLDVKKAALEAENRLVNRLRASEEWKLNMGLIRKAVDHIEQLEARVEPLQPFKLKILELNARLEAVGTVIDLMQYEQLAPRYTKLLKEAAAKGGK
jgi:hypothetical protein